MQKEWAKGWLTKSYSASECKRSRAPLSALNVSLSFDLKVRRMCFSTTSRSFRPWQKTRCPQLWQKESCMTPALANGFRSLLASRITTKPITSTGTILALFPNSLDVADFLQNRVKPSYRKHLISGMPLPAAKTSTKHTKKPATAAEPRQLTASKHPQAIYTILVIYNLITEDMYI